MLHGVAPGMLPGGHVDLNACSTDRTFAPWRYAYEGSRLGSCAGQRAGCLHPPIVPGAASVPAGCPGKQPILTFVTAGELAQWTKLRHWVPRSPAMLDSWLADKPVIPGSKSITATWAAPPGRPHLDCCLLAGLPVAARHP